MKKAKIIKTATKEKKEIASDTYSAKNLIIIIIVLTIIFGIFYFITTLVLDPVDEINNSNSITEIDTSKITLSNLFNRKDSEYYVLATKDNTNDKTNYTELYNNYINSYSSLEKSLPFYYVDLSDAFNKNYLSDETNISNELNKLKLNDNVLFKIKDSQIEEYFIGNGDIIEALSKLKES